jgi:type II secretory pathway component PulJ
MIGSLIAAFIFGLQLAFTVLAFMAGVAIVAIVALCLFWFFHGMIEAIFQKIEDRRSGP